MEEYVEAKQPIKLLTLISLQLLFIKLRLEENSNNYTVKLCKVHLHPQNRQLCHTFSTLAFSPHVYTQMSVFYFFLAIDFYR